MDVRGDEVPPPTLQEVKPQISRTVSPAASGIDRKDWHTIRETENVLKDELTRQTGAEKLEDC